MFSRPFWCGTSQQPAWQALHQLLPSKRASKTPDVQGWNWCETEEPNPADTGRRNQQRMQRRPRTRCCCCARLPLCPGELPPTARHSASSCGTCKQAACEEERGPEMFMAATATSNRANKCSGIKTSTTLKRDQLLLILLEILLLAFSFSWPYSPTNICTNACNHINIPSFCLKTPALLGFIFTTQRVTQPNWEVGGNEDEI